MVCGFGRWRRSPNANGQDFLFTQIRHDARSVRGLLDGDGGAAASVGPAKGRPSSTRPLETRSLACSWDLIAHILAPLIVSCLFRRMIKFAIRVRLRVRLRRGTLIF